MLKAFTYLITGYKSLKNLIKKMNINLFKAAFYIKKLKITHSPADQSAAR